LEFCTSVSAADRIAGSDLPWDELVGFGPAVSRRTRGSGFCRDAVGLLLLRVDPHWAGIGGQASLIDELIGDERLDVVRADPAEEQPFYR
jgi:hypothetical protein